MIELPAINFWVPMGQFLPLQRGCRYSSRARFSNSRITI